MDPDPPPQQPSRSSHQHDRPFPFSHTQNTEDETDVRDLFSRQNTESEEEEQEPLAASGNNTRDESQGTGTGDESLEDSGSGQNGDSDSDIIMGDPSIRDSGSEYVPSSPSAADEEAALSSDQSGDAEETQETVAHQPGELPEPTSSIPAPAIPSLPQSSTQQSGGIQAQESLPTAGPGEHRQGDHPGSGARSDQTNPDFARPHIIHPLDLGYSPLYTDPGSIPPRPRSYSASGVSQLPTSGDQLRRWDITGVFGHQLQGHQASRVSNLRGAPNTEEGPIGNDDQGPQDIASPAASGSGVLGVPSVENPHTSSNPRPGNQLPYIFPLPGAPDDRHFQSPIDQAQRFGLPGEASAPPLRVSPPARSQSFSGGYTPSITALASERLIQQTQAGQARQSQSQFARTGVPSSGDHTWSTGQQLVGPPFTQSLPNPLGNNQQNPPASFNPGNPPVPGFPHPGQPVQNLSNRSEQHANTRGLQPGRPFAQWTHRPGMPPYRIPRTQGHNTGTSMFRSEDDILQEERHILRQQRQQQDGDRGSHRYRRTNPLPSNPLRSSAQRQPNSDPRNILSSSGLPWMTESRTTQPPGQNIFTPTQRTPFDPRSGIGNRPDVDNPFLPQGPLSPQPPSLTTGNTPIHQPDPSFPGGDPVWGPRRPGVPNPSIRVPPPVQPPPLVPSNSSLNTRRQARQRLREQDLSELAQENGHLATTDVAPTVNDASPGGSEFDKKPRAWCRMDAEDGFQINENEKKEGQWRKAIRHDTIREALLRRAISQHGQWRYSRDRGSDPLDRTSVHPDQIDWNEDDRNSWPEILFEFEKRNPSLEDTEPRGDWMWGDRVIVDRDNRPLTNWPRLNTCCSTKFEGWAMEALLRMCNKMTPTDIWQRTMPIPSSTRKDPGRTAYNARRDRFRRRNGLIAWTQRPGSKAIKDATWDKIGDWGQRNNSTRYWKGFSKSEMDVILEKAKTSTGPEPEAEPTKSGIEKETEHEENDEGEKEGEAEEAEEEPEEGEDFEDAFYRGAYGDGEE